MKKTQKAESDRLKPVVVRGRRKAPQVEVPEEVRNHWRSWLAQEYRRPRDRPPSPQALNQEVLRALQAVFSVLDLSPCQIEKHTGVTRQHQRKLRLAAAGEQDLHLSLHTLAQLVNGLKLNLHRFLQHLLENFLQSIRAPKESQGA